MTRAGALLLSTLLLLLAACGGDGGGAAPADGPIDDDGLHGTGLTTPYVVPATQLRDDADQPWSPVDVEDDVTLVFFGYTHCPDICGIVMATIAAAVNRLDAADQERVGVVFVTTDPARDDPETLRDYLDGYDPDFAGATGEMDQLQETARALAVHFEKGAKLPSGGYEVVHSDPVVALDDQDRATTVWSKDISAAELAEDLEVLLDR